MLVCYFLLHALLNGQINSKYYNTGTQLQYHFIITQYKLNIHKTVLKQWLQLSKCFKEQTPADLQFPELCQVIKKTQLHSRLCLQTTNTASVCPHHLFNATVLPWEIVEA